MNREKEPLWYKRGVIYEAHVRAFHDSNGDGVGDFPGLTEKLDHLRDLGVTALWLLPFYPSPLKDDGYDIADYYGIHPMYGSLADFKVFLREAHRHGLRVITELVLNHTSDQHPWFQRARRAAPGSKWRDYYVWSDTPDKYKGTRVIFKDTEISNWTWDHLAGAFYWHRFYAHQPDLNFDHPAVHEEMFKVLGFWMDMGVDGVRLDAVPYLYEREGSSCENLPETHRFLKRLRQHVDEKYGDRMLLAEANQWPDESAAYFGGGSGDECHMAFHFPLMPRLFMSLRMEDRIPIVDILEQTPAIPATAQWALFLRNHDELTLEMVTDEERDYMYRMYAHVYQARLNLGIRRRLAPLLGNDRRRIELLNALLFSLPGTPVIYYGDEIGMGENIYLGDRNGVRTPMQWSADKNAGFSRANPQSLYLPINLDPENHYEAVNVEVQQRNPFSLLWWMKRLIALHKRWKAFGLGTLEFLHPENRRILAWVRRYQEERVLVVANLSRFVQPVELDLSPFRSMVPVELFGRTQFPSITEKPYFLSLGPHAFNWFSLEPSIPAQAESTGAHPGTESRVVLSVREEWGEVFHEDNHLMLEEALRAWLPTRRWFGGKARTVKGVHVQEVIPVSLPGGSRSNEASEKPLSGGALGPIESVHGENAFLVLVQVEYGQTEPDLYVLPLACGVGGEAEAIRRDWPTLILANISLGGPSEEGVLYDGMGNRGLCLALLDRMARRRHMNGNQGQIDAIHTAVLGKLRQEGSLGLEPSVSKSEQSNSSVIYGDKLILKFFRRLEGGVNPDLEISRFLTARHFTGSPPLAGALEYRRAQGEPITVAMLSSFVPGCKNAWEYTLETLSRYYERIQTQPAESRSMAQVLPDLVTRQVNELPATARELIGTYLESARTLGERTAAMHLALAAETRDPAFAPEPFTPHAQRGLFESMRNMTSRTLHILGLKWSSLPPDLQRLAQEVLKREDDLVKRFRVIYERSFNTVRIRHHGDYHLGQVLYTGKDFLIIDFEGEPAIPLSERRLKRSPLRDVAGMIRSFHYAAHAALLEQAERGTLHGTETGLMASWGRFWSRWVGVSFFGAYRKAAGAAPFFPPSERDLQAMMEIYLLRKAVYELGYELNHRPSWAGIPLQGILELLNAKEI